MKREKKKKQKSNSPETKTHKESFWAVVRSRHVEILNIIFILLITKILTLTIEHMLDELVPFQQVYRLFFVLTTVLLFTLLYFACTEHHIKRQRTLEKEREILQLLLCGEKGCA